MPRPLTPEEEQRRRSLNKKILSFGCLPVVALIIVLIVVTSSGGDGGSGDGGKAPAYEVTKRDTSGNQRTITVEVDTTKNLKEVFDDVTTDLTDEAGYYVEINCSTGGAKAADNRLANGRKAIGRMGAAATGLKDGQSEFEPVRGAKCPAA